MRIWVVVEKLGKQTQSLVDAARARGHHVASLKPSETDLLFDADGPRIHAPPSAGALPDIALTRIPGTLSGDVLHVVRQLEHLGVPCINDAASLDLNRNKIRANAALAAARLPIPATVVVAPLADDAERRRCLDEVPAQVPGPPWIVKLAQGSQGEGVILAESAAALRALLDSFAVLGKPVLVQRYVAQAASSDIRAFLVGGRCVAAVERSVPESDFRANGIGDGCMLASEPRLSELAEAAARTMGLDIAGIDLVRVGDDFLILDVNSSPGLLATQKIIDATAGPGRPRVDLAAAVIRQLELRAGG
jgi:ribosomal protein S6--L-glutamate ligase